MKLLIKDTFFGITDITSQEKNLIENRFTYKDDSQAMTKYGYKKEKVKTIKFAIKKENSLVLRSGFLQEFLKFAKEYHFKVDEIKDIRTRFEFQKKEFSYDELRAYFNLDFKYVDHQIRALKALLKTNWGIIKAPTSSGKTEIIIGLMKISKLSTLILVDSITLAIQTRERIKEAGLECGICSGQGKIIETNMISTIGSVKKLNLTSFKMIIVDECFPGKTMVHTENGMKPISSLVKSKSTEKVWSFNLSTKKYELNKIYDWYEKKTDSDLIEIWYNNRNNVKSTPNHKYFILENNGIIEKKAEDLVVGDRCIVLPSYANCNGKAPRISKKQYQSILGMVLGDGCLSKTKNLARLRFSQGYKQLDYLNYKLSILDNMYFRKNATIGKSGYCDNVVYSAATQSSVDFLDLYNKVYINGTKKVYNIIKEIDEISLAFWIMDDGCLQNNHYYELSTHSFTKEENELIIKILKEKFDISANIRFDKRINKYFLYITTDSSRTLSSLISPYICNSMQYKLLEKDRNNFNFIIDDKINYGINEIKKINRVTPVFKSVYNISVENNHNYLVGSDVLVSNCHIASAARFQEFFSSTSFPVRFGFSATPDGNDKYKFATIRQYLGGVISEVYTNELMENEVIAPPEIHFKQISCIPTMDWQSSYISNIVENSDRNRIAADIANNSGVPTLVLYKIIDHGKELEKLIPDSILLSGGNNSTERENAIHKFKKGEVRVLIASNIFKQGISINNIQTLVNVSGGKSKIEVLQKIGRALRKHPGKEVALVYDFLDKGNDFTYRHSLQRMKLYKDNGYTNIILDKD